MGGNFKFILIEPPALKSQSDGRRLALETIRELRDAGKIHCSAHPEEQSPRHHQCGALLAALVKLESEGTSQSRTGFAVVLTDLLGRALSRTLVPEIFEEREREGEFLRWKGEPPRETGTGAEAPDPRNQPDPARSGALTAPGPSDADRGHKAI